MSPRGEPIGLPLEHGAVVTVGTFDGVHRGHQDVLATLVRRAAEQSLPSVVVTFDPHPLEVVNPAAAPPLLTLTNEKLAMFAQSGVSYVAVLPFTPRLAALEAEQFVDDVLLGRFALRELLVGHDHGFGRGRLGDIEVLRQLGHRRGFQVTVLPPVHTPDGHAISSTAIRRAVAGGDLARAAAGLGRPYSISGRIVRGDQRGRTIGYPMLNLGPRPTVGDFQRRIETHVFDASGDWYGAHVRLDFVGRLRGTRPFPGLEALKAQLAEDEAQARVALATARPAAPLS